VCGDDIQGIQEFAMNEIDRLKKLYNDTITSQIITKVCIITLILVVVMSHDTCNIPVVYLYIYIFKYRWSLHTCNTSCIQIQIISSQA